MRVLVAGVGNIFLTDDGFGTEVVRRLAAETWPADVRVRDFGIGAVHLAYELADGYDRVIVIDASPRGEEPGTLSVIEPELEGGTVDDSVLLFDPHSMTPDTVFDLLARAGDGVGKALVVACEPQSVEEGIGLTSPVEAAVEGAASLVRNLIEEAVGARTGSV